MQHSMLLHTMHSGKVLSCTASKPYTFGLTQVLTLQICGLLLLSSQPVWRFCQKVLLCSPWGGSRGSACFVLQYPAWPPGCLVLCMLFCHLVRGMKTVQPSGVGHLGSGASPLTAGVLCPCPSSDFEYLGCPCVSRLACHCLLDVCGSVGCVFRSTASVASCLCQARCSFGRQCFVQLLSSAPAGSTTP